PETTSSIPIFKIPIWDSPNSLTSGSLVINQLVALDLTTCENFSFKKRLGKNLKFRLSIKILITKNGLELTFLTTLF
ncbi:hypothetical protein ACVRWD_10355, partial [Streptococcus varani]